MDIVKENLSLEYQVVFYLSKMHLFEEESSHLCELLDTDMDWSIVIGQIELHRIAGIAWKVLNKYVFCDEKKKFKCPRLIRYLRNTYQVNSIMSNEQYKYTSFICDLFDESGINYVLLKGLFDAQYIYEDIGLRSFNDNDILVHPNQVQDAINLLKTHGYIQGKAREQRKIIPANRKDIIKHSLVSHEVFPLAIEINDTLFLRQHIIDLHFSANLMSRQKNADLVKELLDSRIAILINGKKIFGLSPEYALWFLCQHLYKEAVSYNDMKLYKDLLLYKFCDIYNFLKKASTHINWEVFINRVKQLGQEKDVYFTLYQTSKLFGENICPDQYLSKLEPITKGYMNEIYKYDTNEVVYRHNDNILKRIFDFNRPSKIKI
ncbi:nucleotidyltransferase family protein (plasmid) [Bacillus cereus]|uniref:Nucleotidyltransferase family protein n=1 Tax=Bacillus cereus TaxID=1396 RepID=A0AB73USI4_BACCE|nr:nucleotidyltransferase family protein [Bacillus cereus]HDR3523487.1 nucleotidyltransferase family protein [Bacillus pacificus]QHV07979.1 hypothetical protein C1N82_32810 [Bacillus cereus]QHV47440.1 nucleotidyltransferase family protein [Bacillus cereus]HDR3634044.1 nucleotidyltransferase family protein [Bacillus pacificus]HDR7652980.1 nucleotidyltransferase family protein [Bacillus pacificus]